MGLQLCSETRQCLGFLMCSAMDCDGVRQGGIRGNDRVLQWRLEKMAMEVCCDGYGCGVIIYVYRSHIYIHVHTYFIERKGDDGPTVSIEKDKGEWMWEVKRCGNDCCT